MRKLSLFTAGVVAVLCLSAAQADAQQCPYSYQNLNYSGDGCGLSVTFTSVDQGQNPVPIRAQLSYCNTTAGCGTYNFGPAEASPVSNHSLTMIPSLGEGTYWVTVIYLDASGNYLCDGPSFPFEFGPAPWESINVTNVNDSAGSGSFSVSWLTSESWECRLKYRVGSSGSYSYTGSSTGISHSRTISASQCTTYEYAVQIRTCGSLWTEAAFGSVTTSGSCGGGGKPPKDDVTMPAIQARPNPSQGPTLIRFSLPQEANVGLSVFDIRGRRVAALSQGQYPQGDHFVSWSGRDQSGAQVATGIYFIRLTAGDLVVAKRLLVTGGP